MLLLRHALAPGGGDPAGFQLRDCSTQRNLDAVGQEQARSIGNYLRQRGIASARVWSSQWCRCLETANLLDVGEVREQPGLNSFFGRPEERAPNLAALKAFLDKLTLDGPPLVLVTHYVTIGATTGETVGSGEGVLARIADDGALSTVAVVDFSSP